METVIEVAGLRKAFGSVQALAGLDLVVQPGEVVGFVGPNGAGKSTTIRILLGLLRRDGGQVRLLGGDPWSDAVRLHRRLAYVPGDVALWPSLSGGETIGYLGRLHGSTDQAKLTELIERFEFDPTKKARTYSKGNRQKVALIAALAQDAELYIFDEPTSGLDPLMEAVFTDQVRQIREQGKTVLLSSHILAEVEKLCDTITIIRAGRCVESGSMASMRHLTTTQFDVVTRQDPAVLVGAAGIGQLELDGHRAQFSADNAELAAIMATVTALGVESLQAAPPSLEDLFLKYYGASPEPTAARR